MNKIFFLLLFSIWYVNANAQLPPVYEIKADTAVIKLPDSCWQMLGDASEKWTIKEISQSPLSDRFYKKTSITDSSFKSYWQRFRIKNNMDHDAVIYTGRDIACFDLYTNDNNGSWKHQQTGNFVPWNKRDGIKNYHAILITISPGHELLVYQRLKFNQKDIPTLFTPTVGFTPQLVRNRYVIEEKEYFDNIRRGIMFGICLLAAIFCFFFFLTAREPVYFHASMLYFCSALMSMDSLKEKLFPPDSEVVAFFEAVILLPVFLYFLVSTVRHSLDTKHKYPQWDKILNILSVVPFLWYTLQYFYPSFIDWNSVINVAILLPVIIISLQSVRKKNKTARLLIAGVFLLCVLGITLSLTSILNISPPAWVDKHILDFDLVVFTWIIAISTWMLFERYRNLQKRLLEEAFEKEQLAKEKEIERRQLIEQQKLELEKQVTERTAELKQSLEELKATQTQLIHAEKMASLGELTAGIAHEIQNPLNFVNNFSEVSSEMIDEMKQELAIGNGQSANEIASDVKQNLEKIIHHGKRADAIVKSMLQHSRSSGGKKELTDINALADEYLRLAYHGMRAKDKSFNSNFETNLDPTIGKVSIVPQEVGRVILNLINNAFYTVAEKKQKLDGSFEPKVSVSTRKSNGKIEIEIKDNGNGIPQKVLDKIFQPFFTTKPTGEGTGLGLSLSYDIITKGHGGELKVKTSEGEGSSFIILLPNPLAS